MAGKLGAGFSVEKVAGTVSETTLRKACGFLLMSLPLCLAAPAGQSHA